jgi:hypothetical protein
MQKRQVSETNSRASVARLSMSDVGQKAKCSSRENGFRFATNTRHCVMQSALRICANTGHRDSNPLAVKACLTAGDVRYAISALAASTCLLLALIPATYKE